MGTHSSQLAKQAVTAVLGCLYSLSPDLPARSALAGLGIYGAPLSRVPAQTRLGPLPSWSPWTAFSPDNGATELPVDLTLVLAGARPMALLHGPEQQTRQWLAVAFQNGLCGLTSAIEFEPVQDSRLGRYANLMGQQRPARFGSGAWRGVFIGPDPAWVLAAWLAEQRGWDGVLGACLGYPSCCIDQFEQRWPIARQHYQGDPGLMLLAEAGDDDVLPWELNLYARYSGPCLTEHFPCSWHCAASIQRATQLSFALAFTDKEAEAEIRQRMQRPVNLLGRTLIFSKAPAQAPEAEIST